MKISYNWLKQFINIEWDAEKTGDLLTDLGLEVEGIEPFESIKGGLQGVVVGKVISCKKHVNADKLKVTTVDIGNKNIVQIVSFFIVPVVCSNLILSYQKTQANTSSKNAKRKQRRHACGILSGRNSIQSYN